MSTLVEEVIDAGAPDDQNLRLESGATRTSPDLEPAETHWICDSGRDGRVRAVLLYALGSTACVIAGLASGTWIALGIAFILGLAAWNTWGDPYVVHAGRGWVEFVSLAETRKVHASEIRRIVRNVLKCEPSQLHHLDIVWPGGSVTLNTDRKAVFQALTRLSPAAGVSTEVYEPPDAD